MTDNTIPDLDATIANAVNARIEAEVARALSGDEVIGRYVAAALAAPVEVKSGGYRTSQKPFLQHVLHSAIRKATQEAVNRLLADEMPLIEDEIRKALKRDAKAIAERFAGSLTDAAARTYGVTVELKMPHD